MICSRSYRTSVYVFVDALSNETETNETNVLDSCDGSGRCRSVQRRAARASKRCVYGVPGTRHNRRYSRQFRIEVDAGGRKTSRYHDGTALSVHATVRNHHARKREKQQIVVVLDTDGATTRPKLYVDANGNGDLTDDPPVVLAAPKVPLSPVSGGARAVSATPNVDLTAIVPVVAHYDVAGRGGVVPSALSFSLHGTELTYNREYGRVGTLTVGGRVYRIALVDQAVNGTFNDFQHGEADPSKVTLFVDKNRDGRFDPQPKPSTRASRFTCRANPMRSPA